ncbi:hypothetical protein U9M48_033642 [Paspalum notatum var. saurae]|uniref:Glutaredoxin domain-containing protein n=1 Tax=Paspalum notatum var. saurae TaxID=547442 RepID=A0AAQ3X6F0_PASNO
MVNIKENPVLIYMKGFPESPMCGFSALAVKVLQQYGVPICGRDILGDLNLKEGVKAHTNWPTFPQIFIKGEFIGRSDIILSMHQASSLFLFCKGELKDLLGDIAQQDEQKEASHEAMNRSHCTIYRPSPYIRETQFWEALASSRLGSGAASAGALRLGYWTSSPPAERPRATGSLEEDEEDKMDMMRKL